MLRTWGARAYRGFTVSVLFRELSWFRGLRVYVGLMSFWAFGAYEVDGALTVFELVGLIGFTVSLSNNILT